MNRKISELSVGTPAANLADLLAVVRGVDNHKVTAEQLLALAEPGMPALKKVTTVLQAADIATLYSSPAVVVPGVAGKFLVPDRMHIYRAAGFNAWSWNIGNVRLGTPGSGSARQFFVILKDQALYLLGINEAFRLDFNGKSPAEDGSGGSGFMNATGAGVTSFAGEPLVLDQGNENPQYGTGGITVTVWYREWSATPP